MAGATGEASGDAPLTRERIVDRALELLDEHGLARLSMRKLAAELGVSAQALYWHFANKDALCEAVVATVAADLRAIDLGRGGVERRLTRYCHGLRDHWRRHPSALELGRRFAPTAAGPVAAQGVQLLRDWGFEDAAAHERHRALVWVVLGFVHVEHGVASSRHHRALDDDGRRYAVQLAEPDRPGHELDADRLFADVVALTVAGLRVAPDRR